MSNKKRPLPVPLTEEQHAYLKSKGKMAEYMRNLLVVDMSKQGDALAELVKLSKESMRGNK